MIPDRDLLRQYAEQDDEAAFAEVVRRHVDWVYSAARRVVAGDVHLAQDVTQAVFCDLARKAAKLSRYDAPGGWLHTATRYAAIKAVDRERRRREREHEAYTMQNQPTAPEMPWEQLQPVLDEAIGRLGESDRQAVVMRFFECKSHREIGDVTGLSEDSARKRVERAVEKLRAYFSRKGIQVSSGLLAESIGANSVRAAPVGLAESSSLAAVAHAAAASGFMYVFFNSLLLMTTTTKTIVAAVIIIVAVASYHFVVQSANDTTAPAASSATSRAGGSATPSSRPPQVAMPKQAAVMAATGTPASAPLVADVKPAGSGNSATSVPLDPNMQDAMAIMQPMKALYAEIYTALMQTNDPDTALLKFQDLQPQIDVLKEKIVGTPLEAVVSPALAQLAKAKTALQHGDIEGAQKIIQSLNKVGANVQTKIENTAGISIKKAAGQQEQSKENGTQ